MTGRGPATISLRAAGPDDDAFLCRVYGSTREAELALTGWDDGQKRAFVRMQHEAQDRHYRQHYAGTSFDLILLDGEPVGRLYVGRWADEIRIVDISLLPGYRGRGIGTSLLEELLAEGAARTKRVSIHVERFNPALRLYSRLGFVVVADKGVYLLMQWSPPAAGHVKTAS